MAKFLPTRLKQPSVSLQQVRGQSVQEVNVNAQPSGPAGGAGGDGGGTGGDGGGGRMQPVRKPQPWQPSWLQLHILHQLRQVSRLQKPPLQAPSSRLDTGNVMSTPSGMVGLMRALEQGLKG